jgi:L-arabinokinase
LPPRRLLFYVSGHGFGHATRSVALMAALRARAGRALEIGVRSDAPHWIFTERDPALRCAAAAIDPGVLQPNGLDLDLPRTLAAHEALAAAWDESVEREAQAITDFAPNLVVGDIPPLAFAAAQRAGVAAFAVANFSWDWILEGYAEADPRWQPIAARYRAAYAGAEALFRLPFHGDFPAFRRIVDVPLLVNRSARAPEECRRQLGLLAGDRRPLVLVSFGGFGSSSFEATAGDDLSDTVFVAFGPRPRGFAADWIELPRSSPIPHEDLMRASAIPHEDLMRASDAVIGKPGYGTVAEAIVHRTRFLYLPRRDFREIPVLEAELARHARARPLPRHDFEAGRWQPHLDALFALPEPGEPLAANGAELIADALLDHL